MLDYSFDKGKFKCAYGIEVDYIQYINLDYLWTIPAMNLPKLLQDNVIYCIHNKLNNKCYIGQTVHLFNRFRVGGISHLAAYENKSSHAIYQSINKHNPINYTVYIIEQVDDRSELDQREMYWIKELHTCTIESKSYGYNMTYGGKSTEQLLTDDSKSKAFEGRVNRNKEIFGDDANSWTHCKDKSIRIKSNQSNAINAIKGQIELLISHGIEINPENYFKYYGDNHKGHNIRLCKHIHIENICTRLYDDPPITSNPSWDPSWTDLVNWFDNVDNWESIKNIKLIAI